MLSSASDNSTRSIPELAKRPIQPADPSSEQQAKKQRDDHIEWTVDKQTVAPAHTASKPLEASAPQQQLDALTGGTFGGCEMSAVVPPK
eukprot:1940710-Prymnesium_polylepis.1